jgi:hypothetical protein
LAPAGYSLIQIRQISPLAEPQDEGTGQPDQAHSPMRIACSRADDGFAKARDSLIEISLVPRVFEQGPKLSSKGSLDRGPHAMALGNRRQSFPPDGNGFLQVADLSEAVKTCPQGVSETRQTREEVFVACRRAGHSLVAGHDGLIDVCPAACLLEPSPQRKAEVGQRREPVACIVRHRCAPSLDRLLKVVEITCDTKPVEQHQREIRQRAYPLGVSGRPNRNSFAYVCDCLIEVLPVTAYTEPIPQRDSKVRQPYAPQRTIGWSSLQCFPQNGDGLCEIGFVASLLITQDQRFSERRQPVSTSGMG